MNSNSFKLIRNIFLTVSHDCKHCFVLAIQTLSEFVISKVAALKLLLWGTYQRRVSWQTSSRVSPQLWPVVHLFYLFLFPPAQAALASAPAHRLAAEAV
ncbi:hypothetical protein MES5069_130124 [Mesorhizobium escarrei]|uniref:Uncharacterized protein n=1 Tax=Mesorhizobium escarrei TaxID=666018 RepID=A0ABM9DI34_9HYPH|nr:hypothetical protein MES5069_130124 [Mesorhizobium escarrei]